MISGEIIESEEGEMLFFISIFLVTIGVFGILHTPVFGLFDLTVFQSLLYASSGAILFKSLFSLERDRYVRLFSFFYALLAIVGLFIPNEYFMGIFSFEGPNNFLHIFFAFVFLYIWRLQDNRESYRLT